MPVAPLARHDGGFGCLLLVRSYSDQLVRISSGGSPRRTIRRLHAGFCADGNLTSPPWAAPQVRTVSAFSVYGIQYTSPSLGATVVGIGDSIMTSSCPAGSSYPEQTRYPAGTSTSTNVRLIRQKSLLFH
jgi:hypothetical protein